METRKILKQEKITFRNTNNGTSCKYNRDTYQAKQKMMTDMLAVVKALKIYGESNELDNFDEILSAVQIAEILAPEFS